MKQLVSAYHVLSAINVLPNSLIINVEKKLSEKFAVLKSDTCTSVLVEMIHPQIISGLLGVLGFERSGLAQLLI